MTDAFENAPFYGDADEEVLFCHDWNEYVLDALNTRDDDERFAHPLEVTAYQRLPITNESVQNVARGWAEDIAEGDNFEEHLSPRDPLLESDAEDELRQGLQAVLARVLRLRANVWGCEPVAKRVFSPEELRAFWEVNGG